jgi:hypothetical protein
VRLFELELEFGGGALNVFDLINGEHQGEPHRAVARLLGRLVIERPPTREHVLQACSTESVRFGPFAVGDRVLVVASVNAFVVFGDSGVSFPTVPDGGDAGLPLLAYQSRVFTVGSEGESHCAVIAATGEGVALAYPVNSVLREAL